MIPEVNKTKVMSSEVWLHESKIQKFYEKRVVLLTGGTGFLGKILIEKLLRSCPNIGQIYLLVREKNGVSAEDRLRRLLEDAVFCRLKKENPRFLESLSVVCGDLHKPRLGLITRDEALLIQQVDVVLHSAATLRFQEELGVAINTNVAATKKLCQLAEKFINLKAFIYVSTAYSNCDSPLIQERVSVPPVCPETLINLAQLLDRPVLNNITPSLIGSKPNTYIFTKCAAEEVVNRFKGSLPLAILRPSIVISTLSEPMPGWIDNVQGATGVVASSSAGLLRTVMCNDQAVANLVPVDYTANAIIALAYSVASQQWQCSKDEDGLPVVNFVSTRHNSITWCQFGEAIEFYVRQNPSPRLLWYPFITRPQSQWTHTLHTALLHYLPANLLDCLSAKSGHPTRLRKLYNRLDQYCAVINYFSMRHFDFEERNAKVLWESLEPHDQQLFPFNMAAVQWDSYFSDYVLGCRQYLLKEDPLTLERARWRIKLLYIIHLVTKSAFCYMGFKMVWFVLSFIWRRFSN